VGLQQLSTDISSLKASNVSTDKGDSFSNHDEKFAERVWDRPSDEFRGRPRSHFDVLSKLLEPDTLD
jgi:hypothetical protein